MSEKKTLLVVVPYLPPHEGGVERYAQEISTRLQLSGEWNVVLITSGDRCGVDSRDEKDGMVTHRLAFRWMFSNTPFSFSWFRKIPALIRQIQPTLIHVHCPVPGIGDLAAFFAGSIPVVVSYHAASMHKGKAIPDFFIWLYEHGPMHFLLKRANFIVCSSDFVRFNFLGSYAYKSETITPATDSRIFIPGRNNKNKRPTVLFVASLNRADQYKGLAILLDAIAALRKEIPDIQLTVVGQGNLLDWYREFVHREGLDTTVVFRGRLSGAELVAAYQSADLFVLPTSNDSFPTVIVEAMSCGLPVISTTVGSIPMLVEDGKTGVLIAPHDRDALVKNISRFLGDSALMQSFGDAGRARISGGFDWGSRAFRFRELYTQVRGEFDADKIRICVVAPYFYPKLGGLENYTYNTAVRLQKSGRYQVSVITSNDQGSGYAHETIDGMRVHRLPITFMFSNTPINVLWYRWLKRIFRVERPDIVHAHAPVPFIADMAALAAGNIPFVVTYHSGSMLKNRMPMDMLIHAYEKWLLPNIFSKATAIVPISRTFASEKLAHYTGKTHVIPPGVDLQRFTPKPMQGGAKVITYVGRIEHNSAWKGIEQLLLATVLVVKDFPTVTLELVGGGDAVGHYLARAKKLGLERVVRFIGPQTGQELNDAYERSSVVVLPSTSEAESFGMVLLEAMATGRPVIGSNIGGIPQVIDSEINGLLVEPSNPKALADAILSVIRNDEMAKKFAAMGIAKAQQFNWEIQVNKYERLFTQILNG